MSALEVLEDQTSIFTEGILLDPLLRFSSKEDPKRLHVIAHGPMTVIAGHMAIFGANEDERQHLFLVGTTEVMDMDQAETHIKTLEMLYGDTQATSGRLAVMNVVEITPDFDGVLARMKEQKERFSKLESTMPGMRVGFRTDWASTVSTGLAISIGQTEYGIELSDQVVHKEL